MHPTDCDVLTSRTNSVIIDFWPQLSTLRLGRNERGEPIASYRHIGWVWQISGWMFKTSGKLAHRLRGIYGMFSNLMKETNRWHHVNGWDLKRLGFWLRGWLHRRASVVIFSCNNVKMVGQHLFLKVNLEQFHDWDRMHMLVWMGYHFVQKSSRTLVVNMIMYKILIH